MNNFFSSIFNKINSIWDSYKNSKIGKILLGNAFDHFVSIVSVGVMLAGLFTPISPLIIGIAVAASITIVAKSVTQTLQIRALRKLHQESNLLLQYRRAKSEQDIILETFPKLKNILKPHLDIIDKVNKPTIGKYKLNSKITTTQSALNIAAQISSPVITMSNAAIAALSGNVIHILKATGYGITTSISLIGATLTEKEIRSLQDQFKASINNEYNNLDTPDYQKLEDLKKNTIKQITQTIALKEALCDPEFITLNDQEKSRYFNEIKQKYENIESFIGPLTEKDTEYVKVKMKNARNGNIFKDFVESLNPFYTNHKLKNKVSTNILVHEEELKLLLDLKNKDFAKLIENFSDKPFFNNSQKQVKEQKSFGKEYIADRKNNNGRAI